MKIRFRQWLGLISLVIGMAAMFIIAKTNTGTTLSVSTGRLVDGYIAGIWVFFTILSLIGMALGTKDSWPSVMSLISWTE